MNASARVFAYRVHDPERYGVRHVPALRTAARSPSCRGHRTSYRQESDRRVRTDNLVLDIADSLKPSDRGELEIADVNREYLRRGQLSVEVLGRGGSMAQYGNGRVAAGSGRVIATIEKHQGLKIACLEEIALSQGFYVAIRTTSRRARQF